MLIERLKSNCAYANFADQLCLTVLLDRALARGANSQKPSSVDPKVKDTLVIMK